MKKTILILIGVVAFTCQVAVGQQLRVSPEQVDVGEVDRVKTVDFYLCNDYDTPFVITDTKASCGCTRLFYSKKPVAPKDSTKITLKYKADKYDVGYFYKSIDIYTSIEKKPKRVVVRGTNK